MKTIRIICLVFAWLWIALICLIFIAGTAGMKILIPGVKQLQLNYSLLQIFTGLSLAAFTALYPTVIHAITMDERTVIKYTPIPISTLNAKLSASYSSYTMPPVPLPRMKE